MVIGLTYGMAMSLLFLWIDVVVGQIAALTFVVTLLLIVFYCLGRSAWRQGRQMGREWTESVDPR
ncbi:MAG: hypothetical protein WAW85_07735 [Gordonia sp. (in: high G+C Gram-positive bacteria)]|uniref:hypothetical protein n=1 Tax=Gordonia sp. (in: high G+C Gram-positive bacteria) TaxID=84139 RepID=UPI003BB5E8AB